MEVLCFGTIVDEELHTLIEKKRKAPALTAQYLYEKAFCEEMCKYTNQEIISVYQMSNFPKEKILFFRKKRIFGNTKLKYIPYINIPFLKELLYFIFTCIYILVWSIKNFNKKQKVIISNFHYLPVSLGIVLMGKILRIKKILTLTDLSLFIYSKERIKNMPFYKRILMKPYVKMVNKLQKSYNLYILFSENMNEVVNKEKKPYIVIEGIYNSDNINLDKLPKKHALAHAGTLNREVGILKILEVFSLINDYNLELWFIGKGNAEDDIKKAAKEDSRIKYIGFKTKDEVMEYLKKAELLINLRNPDDEYTKYSFPSKTFEYMVSGTPFLTTKLKGIPSEYYNYLHVIDNYDSNKIAKIIEEIIKKDDLNDIGLKAQKFIINEKNKNVQVCKIIDFIKKHI